MNYLMQKRFRNLARLVLVRALIAVLLFVTVLPPAVLAQLSQGQGVVEEIPPVMLGGQARGVAAGAPTFNPNSPILANPTALQSLIPKQEPCLRPQPVAYADFLFPTLNEIWPTPPVALLPQALEQRMRSERESREKKRDDEQYDKDKREQEHEARQQIEIQRVQGASLVQPGVPGTRRMTHELSKDYGTEEAFARFSVLQEIQSRLKQFGYDFFDAHASTFAPLTDVPVGPDYVVGPQDTLAIHIWNVPDQTLNRSMIATVDNDGMVVLPQFGAIPVGGLTFSQTERVVSDRLKVLLKRFEVHISLARLRTIKVIVVGEVGRPGAYELSSLASASNAVYAACGATKNGSLRQIRVMRGGKLLTELDLYDLLVKGDRVGDRRLQAGDVIVVPLIASAAAIGGAVRRSAIYELKPATHLSDLLSLAGGLTAVADRQRSHIFRLDPSRGRIILDVDLGLLQKSGGGDLRSPNLTNDPLILDGDYVRVGSIPTQVSNAVSLVGAVKHPGPYEYRPGMKLHELLTPDQLASDAYVDQAELVRMNPVTFEIQIISFNPKALFDGSQAEDHPLQSSDQVVLSSQKRSPNLIVIEGEVKRPGYFTIEFGERLSSALKRAGGFTQNAFPSGIVLIRESVKEKQAKEFERFVATQKQQITAQSASAAGGAASIAGGGAVTGGTGFIAEQQVLAIRLQQLESIVSRVELGRVVITVKSIESLEGTEDDLRLEAGDTIKIPPPPQTVNVLGAVRNSTTVLYRPGLQVSDYIKQVGGVTADGDKSAIYIVRANGTTEAGYLSAKDVNLGDTIVVPQKIENTTPPIALWSTIASGIGSVMLAIAAISVIGK